MNVKITRPSSGHRNSETLSPFHTSSTPRCGTLNGVIKLRNSASLAIPSWRKRSLSFAGERSFLRSPFVLITFFSDFTA